MLRVMEMCGECFSGNFRLPVYRFLCESMWTCRDCVKEGSELQALHVACHNPGRHDLMLYVSGALSKETWELGRRDYSL